MKMKRKLKVSIAVALVLVMLVSILPLQLAAAEVGADEQSYAVNVEPPKGCSSNNEKQKDASQNKGIGSGVTYDYAAAAQYGYDHAWDAPTYSGGDCANFTSHCLAAGGVEIINSSTYYSYNTPSYQNCSGALEAYRNPYIASAAQLLYLSEFYEVISNPSHSEIELGDIVFMQSGYPDGHVVIITGFNGTMPLYSAHTTARQNQPLYNLATFVVKMRRPLGTSPTPTPSGSIQDLTNPKNPNKYPTPPSGTYLNVGDSGNYVKWLQACLNQCGYSCDVDGQFGYGTAEALKGFQRKYSLTVDGGFGPECRTKIISVLTVSTPSISSSSVSNGMKVTISGSSGATFFYTTNGSNPTENSNKYNGAFVLSNSATVKAVAMQNCRFNSGVASKSVTVTKHTVTFKDWNGSVLKTQSIFHGGAATAPANPSRTGYTFTGWDKSFSNVTADLVVTAQYSINTYTVTFKNWDGTVLKTQQVQYGGAATAPANPTRTGYTFTGWDKSFSNVTADLVATAQYSINTYTVTFKNWDGTVLKTQQVQHGGAAAAPANPTRTGYTFTGWDKSFSNVVADLVVTAQYVVNEPVATPIPSNAPQIIVESKTTSAGSTVLVSISLVNNPGFVTMGIQVAFDSNLTLLSVNDSGLIPGQMFSGEIENPQPLYWANPTAQQNCTANGKIVTLTFKVADTAEEGEYHISVSYDYDNYDIYNFNGESVQFAVVNGTLTVTDIIYGDVNGDGKVNNLDGMVLMRHLAKWPSYPASMISPGADVNADGRINNLDGMILMRHLAKWPAYATLPYSSQKDIVATQSDTVSLDGVPTIIVGNAEAAPGETIRIPIELVNNPGLIVMGITVSYDYNLTLLGFEDTGVLPGQMHSTVIENPQPLFWANPTVPENCTANGTIIYLEFRVNDDAVPGTYDMTVTYDYENYDIYNFEGEPVEFAIQNGTVTVASAQLETHTVSFMDWDGTVLDTQEVEYGADATAPADPTREGYTFIGWDSDFTNVTADLVVTAQYSVNSYTITYNVNGEFYAVQTYHYGDTVITPDYNIPTGYTFSGWEEPETMPAENLVLNATLTINAYTVTFVDWNGEVISTQTVTHGSGAVAPDDPEREGYTFIGWDVEFDNITSDLVVMAMYEVTIPVGDVDGDGQISIYDALIILRMAMGIYPVENLELADYDGDGVVTSVDALHVLRFALGIMD